MGDRQKAEFNFNLIQQCVSLSYWDHLSRYLMLRLCLNWLISTSLFFLTTSAAMLCLTNFLSSFILSSLMRYSFSFSLSINSFFSSSSFFCQNYRSIDRIFSCHSFSFSLRYCYRVYIQSYKLRIISGVIVGSGFLFFSRYLPVVSFCYSSLSFYCFEMNCSWFLRSIFSDSMILSLMVLPSSLTFASSFLRSSIFSWQSCQLLRVLRCLTCSFLMRRRLSFSSSSCFNSCLRVLSCSSLLMRFLLLQIFSSCRLTLQILLFISAISNCCFRSSPFFSRRVISSSLGLIPPYLRLRDLSFSSISYSCWERSNICSFNLMFCSMIFYFSDWSVRGRSCWSSMLGGSVRLCAVALFFGLLQLGDCQSQLSRVFF